MKPAIRRNLLGNGGKNWIRFFARTLGFLTGLFWVSMMVASFLGELSSGEFQLFSEGTALFLIIVAATSSVYLSWSRERLGGFLVVTFAVILGVFSYFAAGFNRFFAVLISGGPFFLSGVLFLLSSRSQERVSR